MEVGTVSTEIAVPEVPAERVTAVSQILERAKALTVATAAEAETAVKACAWVKQQWAALENERKSMKRPFDEAVAKLQARFREPLSQLEEAERLIKARLGAFHEAEAKRVAEERRAAEEARREAERVQREAEAEAERQRQAAAEARRRQEEAAAAGDRASAVAAAKEALRAEREAKAAEAQAAPEPEFTAPMVPAKAAKVAGTATRKVYDFEVVDSTKIPDAFWCVDMEKIKAFVDKNGKMAEEIVPGITVTERTAVSVRSKV